MYTLETSSASIVDVKTLKEFSLNSSAHPHQTNAPLGLIGKYNLAVITWTISLVLMQINYHLLKSKCHFCG